jgi:hypothetical protein
MIFQYFQANFFKHYPFHHASYVKDESVTIDLKAMTITLKATMSCESLGWKGESTLRGANLNIFMTYTKIIHH